MLSHSCRLEEQKARNLKRNSDGLENFAEYLNDDGTWGSSSYEHAINHIF